MMRLRTLGAVILSALLVAGLTSCGTRTGDLGAEIVEPNAVASSEAPSPKTEGEFAADTEAPVAETVELATASGVRQSEFVAVDRGADRAAPVAAEEGGEATPARAPDAGNNDETAENGAEVVPPKPEPTPVPAEETPEQRAQRLLQQAERLSDVKTQASLQEADAAYQAGVKLFNDLEYEQAKQFFERALALNPAHPDALQKLRVVNALLGIHAERMAVKIRELEEAERVKIQEAMVALGRALEEARILEERGSTTPVELDPDDKEKVLQDQLENLRRAQDRYRRVKEIINWMPPTFDLPVAGRSQVDTALARVKQKIAQKQDEIDFLRRLEATRQAEDARVRETDLFNQRIAKLLEQVKDRYELNDFKGAERLAIRILQLDPFNRDAESWKTRARAAFHAHERSGVSQLLREETRRSWDDVDEASISHGALLTYPPNWDQITRRTETSIGKQKVEEAWKADIRKKLQRKVTFEFMDTPLQDAITFLRDLANVTMVVDPKVIAGAPPTITLRVTDMSLDLALDWILRLGELSYALKDNAIFISKEADLSESVELKIYDVSDLTQSITDFPGPDMQISTAGDPAAAAAGGGGALPGLGPTPVATPTVQNIAEMIRGRVAPATWDVLGTSIEERSGKLVVMQKPEVHALIDQLLANFRSTQRMMINIESRFLQIRESYLEDIGVEMQGLDPNVLLGDFGDLRRLGGATGFVQPRVPGATDATPPNIPFPGMTNGPDSVHGGSLSEVGSIVNHHISFFSNDPDTISGLDGLTGRVLQGGLSAQVTVLNNMQMQAFIRALAVRESASTLIAPRLTVFNTQRAHMFVARQQSYVADYDISGDSYDPVIRQFLVGVVLDVRPIVSSDRRYVTLEMRPTVTDLVNFVTRQIDSFSVNNGATTNVFVQLSFPIQFPELSIRRVRTSATVPDGGILLVGGLYRNVKFTAENGVPFLSDLPVIGRLFRWNAVDNAKSNLAILVSPRIMIFSEEEEKL